MAGARQQLQNRQAEPVRDLSSKLPIHLAGHKKTSVQFLCQRGSRRPQIVLQVLRLKLFWIRQRPRRLQPHHDVHRTLREENRNRKRVGTTERVKNRGGCGRLAAQFRLLERAHRRQAFTLQLGPCLIQFVPVLCPRRIILKPGKWTARLRRKSSQKASHIIGVAVVGDRFRRRSRRRVAFRAFEAELHKSISAAKHRHND